MDTFKDSTIVHFWSFLYLDLAVPVPSKQAEKKKVNQAPQDWHAEPVQSVSLKTSIQNVTT